MRNKKRNLIITIVLVTIIILGGGVFFFLNYSSDDNSLTIMEKKWISDNTNKVIDVDIYNDMPIYSYNGDGITFNFLDYFTKKYSINFNKISYMTEKLEKNSNLAFMILNNGEKVTNRDILIYEDHYVLLSLDNDNEEKKIGILKDDSSIMKKYYDGIELSEYDKRDDLINALKDKEVGYILLPNVGAMNDILENELVIDEHISDIKKKYVLRANDSNTYSVMDKVFKDYVRNNYKDDYSTSFLNIYFKATETSDLLQKELNARAYKYGYTVNMPYENSVDGNFVGTILNYLSSFEKSAGVEIDTVKYKNIEDLKSAIVSGEVDLVLGNFDYNGINAQYEDTVSIKDEEYVIVSKDDYNINSFKGLVNVNVSVVVGTNIHKLCKDNDLLVLTYNNTDELLKSLDDNSVAMIDKETYYYYKDDRLEDFKIVAEGKLGSYKFLLSKKNVIFNSIFNYYISTVDYQSVRYLYNTDITLNKDYTTLKVIIFIVSLIAFLSATIYLFNRKTVMNNVVSRDEKLKYLDPMTSLKNRSYLNLNIYKWDDNVIYPQSVIVIDINKIKDINDKLGREAGDEIIKKVASILINNQLENTDIIRSGGDEFLIYMVGYKESSVVEYTKKLVNEMKDIPNSNGVSVGYSMILDEIKSVDDAINEAITMMTKNKEKK